MKHIVSYPIFESAEPKLSLDYDDDGHLEAKNWHLDGRLHREDGPASIQYYPDGTPDLKSWLRNGLLHREDGQAMLAYYPDGKVALTSWWLNGNQYTKAEWIEANTHLSPEALVKLLKDPDPEIGAAAQRNPNFPQNLEDWALNLDDWTK